jgi:hypothetical protein
MAVERSHCAIGGDPDEGFERAVSGRPASTNDGQGTGRARRVIG